MFLNALCFKLNLGSLILIFCQPFWNLLVGSGWWPTELSKPAQQLTTHLDCISLKPGSLMGPILLAVSRWNVLLQGRPSSGGNQWWAGFNQNRMIVLTLSRSTDGIPSVPILVCWHFYSSDNSIHCSPVCVMRLSLGTCFTEWCHTGFIRSVHGQASGPFWPHS